MDSTNKTSTVGVRVNEHFRKRMERHAAARHEKLSEYVRKIVEQELERWEEEERKAGMR